MLHYLESDILFTSIGEPILNGILVVNSSGEVMDVLDNKKGIDPKKITFINGALCPGFINSHCHLELSHLKNKLPKQLGLANFISKIPTLRQTDKSVILKEIEYYDRKMYNNGIVAVADISNTDYSFETKLNSEIFYHTFIELFSLNPEQADAVFEKGKSLMQKCKTSCSITPHANYSLSNKLFDLIKQNNNNSIQSIHNQETGSEDQMFIDGTGTLIDSLSNSKFFKPTKLSALQTIYPKLDKSKILMVHNTFTSKEDMNWLNKQNKHVYWCTCPKANLYIEDALPDYKSWIKSNCKITIGTDSLASNNSLDIFEEIKIISQHTNIDLNTLLTWACRNGAELLGLTKLGTFEKGKKPGVNWIKNLDNNYQITKDSFVEPIFFNS